MFLLASAASRLKTGRASHDGLELALQARELAFVDVDDAARMAELEALLHADHDRVAVGEVELAGVEPEGPGIILQRYGRYANHRVPLLL